LRTCGTRWTRGARGSRGTCRALRASRARGTLRPRCADRQIEGSGSVGDNLQQKTPSQADKRGRECGDDLTGLILRYGEGRAIHLHLGRPGSRDQVQPLDDELIVRAHLSPFNDGLRGNLR
jgi:hypothetical protein